MILWRFIYVCGKFHTDTINQTVIGKEFVKLVWGKWKLFGATFYWTVLFFFILIYFEWRDTENQQYTNFRRTQVFAGNETF